MFPYIDALEKATRAHSSVEPPFFQTVRNLIHAMMKAHDAAGELVKQIRKALAGIVFTLLGWGNEATVLFVVGVSLAIAALGMSVFQ